MGCILCEDIINKNGTWHCLKIFAVFRHGCCAIWHVRVGASLARCRQEARLVPSFLSANIRRLACQDMSWSTFCEAWHVIGMPWSTFCEAWHVIGMSWACHWHVVGMSWSTFCEASHDIGLPWWTFCEAWHAVGMPWSTFWQAWLVISMSKTCHDTHYAVTLRVLALRDIHFPDMTKSKYMSWKKTWEI